jgi:hypothetical protein
MLMYHEIMQFDNQPSHPSSITVTSSTRKKPSIVAR